MTDVACKPSDMGHRLRFLFGRGIYCSKLLLERKPSFPSPTDQVCFSLCPHTGAPPPHTHSGAPLLRDKEAPGDPFPALYPRPGRFEAHFQTMTLSHKLWKREREGAGSATKRTQTYGTSVEKTKSQDNIN